MFPTYVSKFTVTEFGTLDTLYVEKNEKIQIQNWLSSIFLTNPILMIRCFCSNFFQIPPENLNKKYAEFRETATLPFSSLNCHFWEENTKNYN